MTTTNPEQPAPEAALPTGAERRLHPLSWLFVLMSSARQVVLPLVALVALGGSRDDRWQLVAAAAAGVALVAASVWS